MNSRSNQNDDVNDTTRSEEVELLKLISNGRQGNLQVDFNYNLQYQQITQLLDQHQHLPIHLDNTLSLSQLDILDTLG
jgi:hypothetical protein